MNNITVSGFDGGRELSECGDCFGSGVRTLANGAEDFDQEFCNCPAGDELSERGFSKQPENLAEETPVEFDISRIPIYPWHLIDWLGLDV